MDENLKPDSQNLAQKPETPEVSDIVNEEKTPEKKSDKISEEIDKAIAKTVKEDTEEEKKKLEALKTDNRKWYEKMPRLIRRHILFFIVSSLAAYLILYLWLITYQRWGSGENDNLFHEILATFLCGYFVYLTYNSVYKKSKVYKDKQAILEKLKKEEERKRRETEEAEKHTVFQKMINDFKSANSYKGKSLAITKLLTVGLESPKLRQEVINILAVENEWMRQHDLYLKLQNLVLWRIKKDLFPRSDRFQEDTEVQDMSIKVINVMEAIIKKHLFEYKEGFTDVTLDLSGKVIPTLTLPAQFIPAGSLLFDETVLWQSSFAEAVIDRISFEKADLYKTSFWRAKIRHVDFEGANLKHAKFRTNIQTAKNISAQQFFSTKDWELCFINGDQMRLYFEETEDIGDAHFTKWGAGKPRRDKLYFNIQQM